MRLAPEPHALALIRARAQAATPGPWEVKTDGADGALTWVSPHGAYSERYADNVFIAHSRTDVELLCDIAEAASELIAMLKKDAPEWFDDDDWPHADNLAAALARLVVARKRNR